MPNVQYLKKSDFRSVSTFMVILFVPLALVQSDCYYHIWREGTGQNERLISEIYTGYYTNQQVTIVHWIQNSDHFKQGSLKQFG